MIRTSAFPVSARLALCPHHEYGPTSPGDCKCTQLLHKIHNTSAYMHIFLRLHLQQNDSSLLDEYALCEEIISAAGHFIPPNIRNGFIKPPKSA